MAALRNLFSVPKKPAPQPEQKEVPVESAPQVRLVFMGTPELAATILRALHEARYNIVGIVTRPDRPGKKGAAPERLPVSAYAEAKKLPLFQPERLDEDALHMVQSWKPDLILVAAYGKLLPAKLLSLPGLGCLNVHPSLLPKYRGASPIQNALLHGETESGVSLIQMDEGTDTGPIIGSRTVPIAPDDTQATLLPKMAEAGARLVLELLPLWVRRQIRALPQEESEATLCQLIEREDGHILWTETAEEIYNRYRALTPWPGLFTFWREAEGLTRLKLLEIRPLALSAEANLPPLGTVFESEGRIAVATTRGTIELLTLQQEGKKPLPVREFLLGNPDLLGTTLT
jgi:methionyl-tRNA formyltransferase